MRIVPSASVLVPLLPLALVVGGCISSNAPYERRRGDEELFEARSMRLHPIFTQVKDWTGDGDADGIDALVEFQDQFGDPTKAAGRVMFELYEYRRNMPDARGRRLANPFVGSLSNLDEQRAHWNRTARSYSFQLAYSEIEAGGQYVLTATFEPEDGGRFFDRIVLAPEEANRVPTTRPTTRAAADRP